MVSQILAVLIFLVMFALIITEKIERHIVTLGCGLLMIILVFGITMHSGSAIMETLNIGSIFTADFCMLPVRQESLHLESTGQRSFLSQV